MPSNRYIRVLVIVGALLLVPLVLTLLNPSSHLRGGTGGGWDWGPLDFPIMGALLFVFGIAIDFAARKLTNPAYRTLAIAGLVLALIAIWVEIAVDGVSQFLALLF